MLRHLIDCHVHAAISILSFSSSGVVCVSTFILGYSTRNQWFIGVLVSHITYSDPILERIKKCVI